MSGLSVRPAELLTPWLDTALPWQQGVFERLTSLERQEKFPHAILLTGSKGLGKARLAALFAAGVLCKASDAEPCGSCEACQLVGGGAHGDFRWVRPEEGKRAIGVDAIRASVSFMQQTPGYGSHKILVVEPAEAMTTAAANALLKTLEEPPGQALLILVSHRPGELPATIRSRCQRFNVAHPTKSTALAWLVENTSCSMQTAEQAYALSRTQPLTAERLIQGDDLPAIEALTHAMGGLVDKTMAVQEVLATLGGHDLDVILGAALHCLEQRLYSAAGAECSRINFQRRDQILDWLAASRQGVNFGRDVMLPELGRLLTSQ